MPAPATLLKRLLIVVHRWLGVALALLFLLWFASGIVMMYWTFSRRHRAGSAAARARPRSGPHPHLAGSRVRRARARRTSEPGSSDDVRRTARLPFRARSCRRRRTRWRGLHARVCRHRRGAALRRRGDAGSHGSGLTSSRFWAYLGAIPHWFYFTPLRKHQPQWYSFVVWSSLIGTIAALMGVVIAVWMYSPRKRYRHAGAPTSIPYRGWKRWHTVTGLLFGVVTTTWAFSGLLSMGPFPIMDRLVDLTVPLEPPSGGEAPARGRRGGPGSPVASALRGSERFAFASYSGKSPAGAVAALRGFEVKELEFTAFAGQPIYLASNGHGETRIVPIAGEPKDTFSPDEVMRVVRDAAG